jgi:isopenicillin N synthase-like dioxygenase
MTPYSDSRVPIIDLSLFECGDPWRGHVAAQIDWAASEFGFFYIIGHGIESAQADTLLESSRRFFAQDEKTKRRVEMSLGGRAWRGYFPVEAELTSGTPDLKEGIYFGAELAPNDPRVVSGTPLHGKNLFPEIPGMRDAVLEYMTALTGLGHSLMAMVARGLRLEDSYFVDRYTGDPTTLFRIFNYPRLAGARQEPKRWGVGAHTDYGLLTILRQDEIGGLEIKHRDRWVVVPYVPDSFVCNIGDMLERLTNGRYISALHRVRNNFETARLSMAFFFDPNFDAVLEPISGICPVIRRPELIDRWDGIDLRNLHGTYGDYLLDKVSKVFPELGRHNLA